MSTAVVACRRRAAAAAAAATTMPGFRYCSRLGSPMWELSRRCISSSELVMAKGKRAFIVDTLALVKRLEAQGVPPNHAEAITSTITEVLNDSLENVAQSFVSKGEMQKCEMILDINLSKFKSEVHISQELLSS